MDSEEVISIILSLIEKKSSDPNSIPTRILKLLKKGVLTQLVDIFNPSFSSRMYPTPLKIAKIIPIHKKDSKLECSNCRPMSLPSNIQKKKKKKNGKINA